jgi:hypothetical protein
MTAFDSTKTELSKLLEEIAQGKIQLPDFQRGWVWDDEHIRSLLVSIARSFPIGAVMLLETGGDARFQVRPVESVTLPAGARPERLILDGQQRLTSLTQVLKTPEPVTTRDEKKRDIKRHYYFDIEKTMAGPTTLEDAIVSVGEDRIVRTNFNRDIVLDLSSPEKEYASFHFPCLQILNSDSWEQGLIAAFPERFARYMQFRTQIVAAFRSYMVPVIELKKETSKEAVCLVFEKVNTGGVQLSVFELVTAQYAADNFNLRRDWYGEGTAKGRYAKIVVYSLLKDTDATEFLQGVSLLHTHECQQLDLNDGKAGKEASAVSAKREHILNMPLSAYQKWADKLINGFIQAEGFVRHLGFHNAKFLPYRPQMVPLAAVLALLGERWLEPQVQHKLTRWFWCGVFGELYGSATETRIALDFQQLLRWINDPEATVPTTVTAAGFQASRLDTMRSRTSAAYRGLYVLLQQQGAQDLFWKARMMDLDRNDKNIDIHHIFPRKWCEAHGIPSTRYDSIINKTAISYKANRKIGGSAPSAYLAQLQNDVAVQLSSASMDSIIASHLITPALLRSDDFDAFYADRRATLLSLVEEAMGKQAEVTNEPVAEDAPNIDDDDDE